MSDSHFEQDRYVSPVFIASWQNAKYEKSAIFEKGCAQVFNNLPNDIHSEKSCSTSKTNHRQFAWIKGKILESNPDPDVLYFKKSLSSEQLATV